MTVILRRNFLWNDFDEARKYMNASNNYRKLLEATAPIEAAPSRVQLKTKVKRSFLCFFGFDIIDFIVKQRKLLEIFYFLHFYVKYGLKGVEFLVTKLWNIK